MKHCVFSLFVFSAISLFAVTSSAQTSSHPLSNDQLASMAKIKAATDIKAKPLAIELAATAKKVYANMLSDHEDQKLRKSLRRKMDVTASRLLALKGESIREIIAVLTGVQRKELREASKSPGAPGDITELVEKLFVDPAAK